GSGRPGQAPARPLPSREPRRPMDRRRDPPGGARRPGGAPRAFRAGTAQAGMVRVEARGGDGRDRKPRNGAVRSRVRMSRHDSFSGRQGLRPLVIIHNDAPIGFRHAVVGALRSEIIPSETIIAIVQRGTALPRPLGHVTSTILLTMI